MPVQICPTDPTPGHARCICIEAHQDDDLTTVCQTGMNDQTRCGRPATHIRRNSLDRQVGSCAYHASSNYGRRARRIA